MFGDAHSTNWAENYQFFLNQNNPTNFERVWQQAYYLYRRIGTIAEPARAVRPGDGLLDHRRSSASEAKYTSQKDEYQIQLAPKTVGEIQAESRRDPHQHGRHPLLPNSWDLHKKITKKVDGKEVEELYDPNVDIVLEEIAKLAGQFGAARIVIEGHTDASMQGQVPADAGQGTVA